MVVTKQRVTSASPDDRVDWRTIDWCQCHKVVKSYQTRIVKAVSRPRQYWA
jgi:hypothetical protein